MSDPRTDPRSYPQPAVELAGFVDNYLYGCVPAPECGVCTALAEELTEARLAKEYSRAYDTAAEIRNHPHRTPVGRRVGGRGRGGEDQGRK